MPRDTKRLNRGAEPESMTGEGLCCFLYILCLFARGGHTSVQSDTRRLDRLRQVVPHAERANTASFLEECITYIQNLQKRIAELEQLAGLSQATVSHPTSTAGAGAPSLPVAAPISGSGAAQQPEASAVVGPASSQGPLDARDRPAAAGTTLYLACPISSPLPDWIIGLRLLCIGLVAQSAVGGDPSRGYFV